MRENDILNNIRRIGIITGIILIFIIVIPFILMGNGITNFLSNENSYNLDDKEVNILIKGNDKAKVYRTKEKKIEEISVEEYVLGVVSSEMPAKFEKEALKAQAIAARTFYYSKRLKNCNLSNGGEICDGVHCQAYMNKQERMSKWDNKERNTNYQKIKKAVKETKGEVLTYKGKLVLYPQFFSTSSGKTENSEDVFSGEVPYLKSINSLGEEISPVYESQKELKNKDFINIINLKYKRAKLTDKNLKESIDIKSRTDGGSVNEIKIGKTIISGVEFRKLFDLRSANFTIEYLKDKVKIKCKGNGHGVGMSQWGANVMAKEGKKYDDILKHYYTGIEIGKIIYK
ncbi:stage II sporulation protein D [Clostridium moniliforme]|uniref:Stage II sporulation protein D n=1 Tax=Clostridium moniliforme TaxID=39489 RepID=A0ABS4F2Z4_9CLOT|nr:stage II sporulation protein D [Clostridium moniliforme]MBP1890625.1 stage II sporulation protein D [Clostridium moniliforme]